MIGNLRNLEKLKIEAIMACNISWVNEWRKIKAYVTQVFKT